MSKREREFFLDTFTNTTNNMSNTTNRPASAGSETKDAWQKRSLGCMWKREAQGSGDKYLSGTLNLKNLPGFPDQDVQIIVFSNKNKTKDTHPDLNVYISEKKPAPADKTAPKAVTQKAAAPKPTPAVEPDQELI